MPSAATPLIRTRRFASRFVSISSLCLFSLVLAPLTGCGMNQKPKAPAPRYTTLPPKEVPAFMKDTIFERIDVMGTEPLNVNNFGIVVNLEGTGDAINAPLAVREYVMKQMERHGQGAARGWTEEARISPGEMLKDPRVAIVRIDGLIPPGARKGQRIDLAVSALDQSQNNTSSLAGGTLWQTELQIGGANPRAPGKVIDNWASAGPGDVFVNPEYALRNPNDPAVKQSLRFGLIPGGGVSLKDRAITFRSRSPQASVTRAIENRIDTYFGDRGVAAAIDEGIVQVFMPLSYKGDWEHFVGVVTHLYFNNSAEYAASKAKQLADEALKPDAPLMDISYCWEGLGNYGMSYVIPLMTHPQAEVAYAAARAAAYNGDSGAITVLGDMARLPGHPFQIASVQTLGSLPTSPVVNQMLRQLLDSPDATVRIEAYRILAEANDASIYSQSIDDRFMLDIIPSKGPPLIYASRRGKPRLAIFGNKPALDLPATFSALDNRLTITSSQGERAVKIFYRDPAVDRPKPILSNPDIAELIARLGGSGPKDAPQKLSFSYGQIVSVVQAMTRSEQVVAMLGNTRVPTPFIIQTSPRVQSEIDAAPTIPEQSRPQGEASADQAAPEVGTAPRTEARK